MYFLNVSSNIMSLGGLALAIGVLIETPVRLKIQGPNVEGIQQAGTQLQQVLGAIPELRSVFAERVAEGFYVNIEVDRPEAARYGLTVADIQRAVSSGIGGENIAENVEGRQRYPVNVRYSRDFRDNVENLRKSSSRHPQAPRFLFRK